MTQIGEGVAAGGGKGPNKPDLEENHWLELEYRYQNGAPIYGTYEAIDSEGMIWTGRLNDEGQVCLAGLPAGNVQVSLLPEENTDTELEETRKAIQTVLDQIIADQRAEAEEYERELEQMGGARRAFTHIHSFGKGLWNGAIGVVEFVGDTAYKVVQIADYLGPINQLGNVLKAGYQSYQSGDLTWDEWYDSVNENLQNEHKRDVARLLGVEPDDLSEERLRQLMQMVAEAYDIAAFIADDQETQDMLKQFAEDMADAQHSVEWAEFAGAGVFELVLGALLAIFTGGAGNVAQAASKLRHAARLRNLGHLFRKLARLLRRKKLNKSVDAPVDQPTSTRTDQPEPITLKSTNSQSKSEAPRRSPDAAASRPREIVPGLSEADQNKVARASTFETKGVSESDALDYLETEEGKEYISLLKESDPNADDVTILERAVGQVQTGKNLPRRTVVEEPLIKLVPSGSDVSPYSPFFTTKEELARAKASGRPLSDYFGLPASSDAANYDLFEITPKSRAVVYESEVAPTFELDGVFTTDGGGRQLVVPNRGQFGSPEKIGSMLDN